MGMMINRRRACGGKKGLLPSGYTQLEYIENTSNAYIDTGIPIGSTDNITFDVEFCGDNWGAWFGAFEGSDWLSRGFFGSDVDANPLSVAIYSKNSDNDSVCRVELPINSGSKVYHIEWKGSPYLGAVVDNTNIGTGNTTPYTPTRNFFLFARNNAGTASTSRHMRIYNFEAEGKIHLIPCINSQYIVGMYDTVSGQFYSSPNGSNFMAPPSGGYVTSGLRFLLDGINKGTDPAAWTDLIGGIKFAWNNSIVIQNDHIDTTSMTQPLTGSSIINIPSEIGTIEVVISTLNGGIVFMGNVNNSIAFGVTNRIVWAVGSEVPCPPDSYKSNKIYSYSISGSSKFKNMTQLSGGTGGYWGSPDGHLHIGGRNSTDSYLFRGNIYCIRIYNRILTEAEVAYNYGIDRKRFNF